MAILSSSAAAQIRVLGGISSSSRNLVFKQRSSLNSNRVSFGLPPPRSSFLTLSSSSIRKPANGILPVAAVGNDDASYDDLERLAVEAAKKLVKEVANMCESTNHLPEGVADEVARLVEEAADFLVCAGETKEQKSAGDTDDTQDNEFKRLVKKAAAILGSEVAHMYGEALWLSSSTSPIEGAADEVEKLEEEEDAKEERSDDDEIEPENHAMTLSDTYDVGDYIKTKVGGYGDRIEGVVISKNDDITLLKEAYGETIYALDNDKLDDSAWIEIKRKKSM